MARKRGNSEVTAIASSRSLGHLMVIALLLILILATPTTLASSSSSVATEDHLFPEFIKWHVYVVNGLSSTQNLFTHCKSKDNDLGTHSLSPGSNFTWSFKTEFFHSTLFWCHVSKDDDASASFEVFWYDARLFDMCNWKNCIWVAKDDGVYLKDLSENLDVLRYGWDPGM